MSIGEETSAFQKQKELRNQQRDLQKAEQTKKKAEMDALIAKNEAELAQIELEQQKAEIDFQQANPNTQQFARDLLESQLNEPYNNKLNEDTYTTILSNNMLNENKIKTNRTYSIEKIFSRDNPKSDGEIYLWYPHVFEKDSQEKYGDSSVVHLSQLSELEKYGAYHFQIYYYPVFNQSLINVINHAIKDLTEVMTGDQIQKSSEEIYETFSKQLSSLGEVGTGVLTDLKKAYDSSQSSNQTGSDLVKTLLDSVGKAFNKLTDITPQTVFKDQSGLIANIYLPLNKLDIRRESGVTSKSNVITNVGTSLLKQGVEFAMPQGDSPSGIFESIRKSYNDSRGRLLNEFKAPRLKNPELDVREFQWELVPRTAEEHRHIMHILSFFASLSTATFERNDMLFHMPPILKMKVLSSKINKDLQFETYELVPEIQYYLIEYGANFNYSEDSVMLDENGMPVGVTLNIRLIKNELVNGRDLFNNPLI